MNENLKKKLTIWTASFLCAGLLLFFYFHAPIFPILLGGAVSLLLLLQQNKQ